VLHVKRHVKAEAFKYWYHGQFVESLVSSQMEYEIELMVLVFT
jgi:hypothetical protein